MPAERCQRKKERGWRWGKTGKCYIPSEEGSDIAAKRAAEKQGRAIKSKNQIVFEDAHITIDVNI